MSHFYIQTFVVFSQFGRIFFNCDKHVSNLRRNTEMYFSNYAIIGINSCQFCFDRVKNAHEYSAPNKIRFADIFARGFLQNFVQRKYYACVFSIFFVVFVYNVRNESHDLHKKFTMTQNMTPMNPNIPD